jgi:hypothetical protein
LGGEFYGISGDSEGFAWNLREIGMGYLLGKYGIILKWLR